MQGARMADRCMQGKAAVPEGGVVLEDMVRHSLIGLVAFKVGYLLRVVVFFFFIDHSLYESKKNYRF